MQLFVPALNTQLRLIEDWKFELHIDYRNSEIRDHLAVDESGAVIIPAKTILRVDRIYIRKGSSDFDSISFTVVDSPNKRIATKKYGGTFSRRQARFWAKLDDCNKMQIEVVS